MKIILIFLVMFTSSITDDPPTPTWPAALHQKVIVKATSLMPESIVRRILINKKDILRGCVDTLKKGISPGEELTQINLSYQRLVHLLKSKEINFRMICYEMGRLSTFLSESSSPLRSVISRSQVDAFGNFVLVQSRIFPLIITHDGEGFLKDKDLSRYLDFQRYRKMRRGESLVRAMELYPDPMIWKEQRSLQFGIASVLYNNMILDSSRIWMMAWEEAGGTVVDAPYFDKGK